jgi:predicted PurR-regulated permease PerM
MGAALAALSGPGAIVIGIIAAVIAIGVLLGQHWEEVCAWANNLKEKVSSAISDMKQKVSDSIEGVKAKFTEMKDKVSNIMNMVKTDISNKIQAAKDKVTSVVNAMKSGVTNTMSGMRSAISSTFESIKSGISNKINAAKSAVSNAMSAIRGLLSGSISFPHITLPHFTVTGSPPFGLGGHGSPPHISVDWYAKAMRQPYILDGATIFGAQNGRLLGGGERGKEVIMGYDLYRNLRGGDVNINMVVNAAPGMDVTELANVVSRKINKQVRELGAVW